MVVGTVAVSLQAVETPVELPKCLVTPLLALLFSFFLTSDLAITN